MTSELDVFISFASAEEASARAIKTALEKAGYTTFATLDLEQTDNYSLLIDEMLREARVVLVLWTKAALPKNTKWVWNEATKAEKIRAKQGAPVYVGVLFDGLDSDILPTEVHTYDHLNVATRLPTGAETDKIVQSIANILGTKPKREAERAGQASADLALEAARFAMATEINTAAAYSAFLKLVPDSPLTASAEKLRDDRAEFEAEAHEREASQNQRIWRAAVDQVQDLKATL